MSMFRPKQKKHEIVSLHLPEHLSKRLAKALEHAGVTKQSLLRQMIEHCLDNIQFEPKIKEKKEEHREEF